jgi:MFS transporter, SET family, sugar efflux transporter
MKIFEDRWGYRILLLLLVGTISNAMIAPFMPYYIVEGLKEAPWTISVYAALRITLTVLFNRLIGRWLDEGARFIHFIVMSSVAYVAACLAIYLFPSYLTLICFATLGFGVSGTFMTVMFTLGRQFADEANVDGSRFNAFLRGTTSTAWMLGPALAFTVADRLGIQNVFLFALALGALRLAVALWTVPPDLAGVQKDRPQDSAADAFNAALWKAATACFFISLGHSICMVALPLFYTKEVGLPTYAPGLALSVKTATEIVAISSTPFLMRRFSQRNILLATACLALVAVFALASVWNLASMVFAQILEGAYYGIYASVGVSFVQSFARGRMGQATSLYVNTLTVTGILAGPIVGLIGQFIRFQNAVECASVTIVIAMVVLWVTRERDDTRSPVVVP